MLKRVDRKQDIAAEPVAQVETATEETVVVQEPPRPMTIIERLQAEAKAAWDELESARVKAREVGEKLRELRCEESAIRNNMMPGSETAEQLERLEAIPEDMRPLLRREAAQRATLDRLEKAYFAKVEAVRNAEHQAFHLRTEAIPWQRSIIASRRAQLDEAQKEVSIRQANLREAVDVLTDIKERIKSLSGEVVE